MTTLELRDDAALCLSVTAGPNWVTATLVFGGMHIGTASAPRDEVFLLASGCPCLAVGCAHFPLAYIHLKELSVAMDMPIRGDRA
ncbi:hypothetical protein [Dyella sp. ASV21]|uniref:hypothetical protein n=1 Tax=Dyella sp. ASV21 TaxID=2795114 RepID=UPI0018ECCA25|nr:hypothetical protein [Dyella sp. ASV21]